MRILIVTPFRYHAIGGVASAVRFLGAEFASQGHDVAVLARGETSFPRGLGRDRSAALFSMHFRDLVGELTETGRWRQLRSIAACLIWLPFSLWGLWRLLRTTQPDVVMIQYPRPRLFCFAIMRAWSRWKLVVTFQGSDAHRLASYPRVSRRLMRHLVRRADGVTAVSRSLAEKIEASTSFPASSISIVPNGASVDGPASETPLPQFPDRFVVTAGKLIPRKGIDVLIRAIGRLRQEGAAIPLVVIGDGSERRALTDLAAAEKAGDLITFLGEVDHPGVLAVMHAADVFVLASRAEGLPLVIAEAMACGTPVIATNVDGTREIIPDERFGLLVGPDDADSLAKAIRRLWDSAELRRRLSSAGRQRVRQEYGWPVIAERYRSMFDALFGNRASGTGDSSSPIGDVKRAVERVGA